MAKKQFPEDFELYEGEIAENDVFLLSRSSTNKKHKVKFNRFLSRFVSKVGNEIVGGVKTFTQSPKGPAPVAPNDMAIRSWVLDVVDTGSGEDVVFKKDLLSFDNSDFFDPDVNQYPVLVTPGSYGIAFVDPPLEAELPNDRNFTLIVEYASHYGSGADGDQDFTHTLVSQSGRRFTRTGKHLPGAFHEVYLQWSDFEEVYPTKSYLIENFVQKNSGEDPQPVSGYFYFEEGLYEFQISSGTPDNIRAELAWNGNVYLDQPLGADKAVNIQVVDLEPELNHYLKFYINGEPIKDAEGNDIQYKNGSTVFAVYIAANDLWTVTASTTEDVPVIPDYSDVAVKSLLTSAIEAVALNQTRVRFTTGGYSANDLFFYCLGTSWLTGLYRVVSSDANTTYADKIASAGTVKTLRIAGDGVYYNQYDGTNAGTIEFLKAVEETPFVTYDQVNHKLNVGLNKSSEAVQNLKLSADFDLELFAADVDIFGIDSAKLRSFGEVTIDSGTGVNINTGTGELLVNGAPLELDAPFISYDQANHKLNVGINKSSEAVQNLKLSADFDLELFAADVDIFGIDSAKLRSFGLTSVTGNPVYIGEHSESVITNDIPAGLTGLLISPADGYIKLANSIDSMLEISDFISLSSSSLLELTSPEVMTLRSYDYINVISNGFDLSSTSGIGIKTSLLDLESGLHVGDGSAQLVSEDSNAIVSLNYGPGTYLAMSSTDIYLRSSQEIRLNSYDDIRINSGGSIYLGAEYSVNVTQDTYFGANIFVGDRIIMQNNATPQNSSAWAQTGSLFADNDYLYYKGTGNLLKRIAWTAF